MRGRMLEQRRVQRRIGPEAIRKSVVFNVVGTLLPALVAFVCIRWIVQGLGTTRFGVLTLAWGFINSVGLLDLGIGRALTRLLAVHHETDSQREGGLIWTSLGGTAAIGLLGSVLGLMFAGRIAQLFVRETPALLAETEPALKILALSIPLVVLSSGLRGILEAVARFDLITRVTIPATLLNFLLPALLLAWQARLPVIVGTLVGVRLFATVFLLMLCVHSVESMRYFAWTRRGMGAIAGFAGWVTVSNTTGPLLVQLERFLIGAYSSLSAVAFFSTPAEVLNRLTLIPGAMVQVFFPVLAQSVHAEPGRATRIFKQGSVAILGTTLPFVALSSAIAPEGLSFWLGAEFGAQATVPGRLLAASVFVNCMAWLPFSLLQGAGRADLTGKLHLFEIPLYLALTIVLIGRAGADGAAMASLLRSTLDAIIVTAMASRFVRGGSRIVLRLGVLVVCGVAMIGLASISLPVVARIALAAVGSCATIGLGWFWFLDVDGRSAVLAEMRFAWNRFTGGPT